MRKRSMLRTILGKDNLGILIAVCAILISAASFYATYLQAKAAEKQVTAMTMPLLRFSHGNYDDERQISFLTFKLKNAGVGPALIRSIEYHYNDETYQDLGAFIRACCEKEASAYRDFLKTMDIAQMSITEGGYFTAPVLDVIVPGQSDHEFYGMYRHENNAEFWEAISRERFNLDIEICYCSLLDACFKTKANSSIEGVKSCPAKQ